MSQVIILVDDPADWAAYYPTRHLLSARDYLQAAQPVCTDKKVQVINLCRSWTYLSEGYYVSLLGEARGFDVASAHVDRSDALAPVEILEVTLSPDAQLAGLLDAFPL